MIAISLQLTAGRYSATPWGRQVNEGMVEWPPSPWRLLRALVAVWRRTVPEVPEAEVAALLHALARPPEFSLPHASEGHSRHYMPVIEGVKEKPSLIFDAFVAVPRDASVEIRWPDLELADGQRSLLGRLLEQLPYLGRAESWCRATLGSAAADRQRFTCQPVASGDANDRGSDVELIQVLAADATCPPADLLRYLHVDTAALRSARRDPYRPPGSRWITYGRPSESLLPTPHRPTRSDQSTDNRQPLTVPAQGQLAAPEEPATYLARYAMFAAVRPTAQRTIEIGELARRAVMSIAGWRAGPANAGRPSSRLSGKDATGDPLRGHQHVFFLPADEDGDGFLDHLNICLRPAKGFAHPDPGFTRAEADALSRLVVLSDGAEEPLRLTLLHLGELDGTLRHHTMLGSSVTWESVTPYLLPRHPKPLRDGSGWRADGPAQQLRRELSERFGEKLGAEVGMEAVAECRLRGQTWNWQAFRRWRSGKDQPPPYRPGFGVRLTFPVAVSGPIALGYGCHFGLGQFRCARGSPP